MNRSRELHEQLLHIIGLSKQSYIYTGKLLYELKRGDLYKLAEGAEGWVEYLAQPEIGLSKGEATRLIQIYEKFVLELGFSEEYLSDIPIKSIQYLLPLVKKGELSNLDEVLEDAKHLSQRDFRERIYDIKTQDTGKRTYEHIIMERCKETGTLRKVHGIDPEEVKRFVSQYKYGEDFYL